MLDPVHTEPDEYLFKYALCSHETHETGRIRGPLTGRVRTPLTRRIRDQKKIGPRFLRDRLKL